MKTILIPTDFSENARKAALYAFSLFDKNKDVFILLNAYKMPHHNSAVLINLNDKLKESSIASLEQEKKEILNIEGNNLINIQTYVELGKLISVIERMVKLHSIDYIVMGTKGATGFENVFIGSNTSDVVQKISCPVLTVPEQAKYKPLFNVIFAADFDKIDNNVVLDPVFDIIKETNAKLHIVNICKFDYKENLNRSVEREKLITYFKSIEYSVHFMFNDNIPLGIEEAIKSVNADLLIMLSRENSFFDIVFKRSVTREMLLHTQTPVLALHEN